MLLMAREPVEQTPDGFFQRTIRNLRGAWQEIAVSVRGDGVDDLDPDLSDVDAEVVRRHMRACLEARGGEVSARARAATLGRAYLSLSETGRERFLTILAQDFDTDPMAVRNAAAELGEWDAHKAAERALRDALDPPRRRLLTQFNALPEGVKFLVDMRAELLSLRNKNPQLAGLEADLKELLTTWFDIGFLELKQITWDSPASVLEKLIAYEAVHAIQSWDDLKNRLASDRRCFAFFHPRMPEEPLIFVEVALTDGVADNVQALLDEDAPVGDPRAADTGIFYSISNAQVGLAGISFGGFLIKRVADQLSHELERLGTFATLSPIPGFRRWLDTRLHDGNDVLLVNGEQKALSALVEVVNGGGLLEAALSRPDWWQDQELAKALQRPLMRLCARYLMEEKGKSGRARDPVGNFHLSNGARMERLNWLADVSGKGIEQSAGLMINYQYRLDEIEKNHEAYVGELQIPASPAMRSLAK